MVVQEKAETFVGIGVFPKAHLNHKHKKYRVETTVVCLKVFVKWQKIKILPSSLASPYLLRPPPFLFL